MAQMRHYPSLIEQMRQGLGRAMDRVLPAAAARGQEPRGSPSCASRREGVRGTGLRTDNGEQGLSVIHYIAGNFPLILQLTWQHVTIVGVAVGAAILIGVPLGIAITQNQRAADIVLYIAGIIMTIPSIALFGVMIPILSLINQGIGYLPAVIAVFLYSQLPIVRNTYTAIKSVDPALREAARGMGMTSWQRLRRVEIPIALPIIMAGIRIAVVINIGIAAIAAYIGAGGLGVMIRAGISQTDSRQLLAGALAVSILAVIADYGLLALQRYLTPRGVRAA
jgi:osmoprotectant transport system permease protein